MDADSSTGLNENSESGELDIPSVDSTGGFDSGSKLSATSDRTNPEALDDTAQDTLFSIPEDSNQSLKFNRARDVVDVGGDHDVLDFEGDDIEENEKVSVKAKQPVEDDEDGEEGELEDDEKPVASPAGSEEGELEDEPRRRKSVGAEGDDKDEGEDDDELEEGEVTDDEDRGNKEPKPVCRFFGKGQCTWGSNCRFLHPGVTDKGLYTMFDTMRPLLPIPNNPPPMMKPGLLGTAPPSFAPMALADEPPIQESAWERGLRTAKEVIKQSVKRKETDIDFEEKKMNLTLAQEDLDKENDYYVRKPSTPPPVVDNSDDDPYLTRFDPATMAPPVAVGPGGPGPWPGTSGSRNNLTAKIDPDFVRDRVHRLHKPGRGMREAPPRDAPIREAPPLHEPEVRMVRESALRRGGKFPDPSFQGPHGHRRNYDDPRKAEEWRDPWMRSNESGTRKSRKDSNVSKRSSYSSGSSRSSSKSSTSSKSSRSSRSSSKSSKNSKTSRSPATKRRRRSREVAVVRKAPPRRISPPGKPVRIAPPPPQDEFGRQPARNFGGPPAHFNRPPRFAPSPPKSPHAKDRIVDKSNPPLVRERDLRRGGRMRKRTWSKRSGSSSRSRSPNSRSRSPWSKSKSKSRSRSVSKPRTRSKFSRDRSVSRSVSRSRSPSRRLSSHSRSASSSSSSSSSLGSPTLARRRRPTPEKKPDAPAPASKPTNAHLNRPAARKTEPPPKAQIRMTLKPSSGTIRANKNVIERLADDNMHDDEENGGGDKTPILIEDDSGSRGAGENSNGAKSGEKESKTQIKRREELLKQLKAVEDAIAKKRSKLGGV